MNFAPKGGGLLQLAGAYGSAAPFRSRLTTLVLRNFFRDGCLRILQPRWRTATTATAATRQTLECQNGFFNLLTLHTQFREHLIYIHDESSPAFNKKKDRIK
jgi:hypothetical protein